MGPVLTLLACLRRICHPAIYKVCAKHIVKYDVRENMKTHCCDLKLGCKEVRSLQAVDFMLDYVKLQCHSLYEIAFKICIDDPVRLKHYVSQLQELWFLPAELTTWPLLQVFLDCEKIYIMSLHDILMSNVDDVTLIGNIISHPFTQKHMRQSCTESTHNDFWCELILEHAINYTCCKMKRRKII